MAGSALELRGSRLAAIGVEGDQVMLSLTPARVIKSEGIPGVDTSTLWTVNAQLVLREAVIEGALPATPAGIERARLRLNQHTYVDLCPLPIEMPGIIRLQVRVEGASADFIIDAGYVRYFPLDQEKYVEHLVG